MAENNVETVASNVERMTNLCIGKLSEGIQPGIDATNLGIGNGGKVVVARLLPEIVSDILSRLPIEDVMRSRCVCKGWYALTKTRHFVHLHLSRALCLPDRIILEPKHQGPLTSFYLVDTKDGMWRAKEIPVANVHGNYICTLSSCHGLLCGVSSKAEVDPQDKKPSCNCSRCVTSSSSEVETLFIYNPFTKESLELPKAEIEQFEAGKRATTVGFGFDHIAEKYKVVRLFKFSYEDNPQTYMKGQIITLGEASWRELEVSHQVVICCSNKKPVFLDGLLHWFIDAKSRPGSERLLAFDLCTEKFRTIKFPSSLVRSVMFPNQLYLRNLGGSLSLVEHYRPDRFQVWRIVRSNTKKGYKFYESSYCMTMRYNFRLLRAKIVGRLRGDNFLFHLEDIIFKDMEERKDHLALFNQEKDEFMIVEVCGLPQYFKPNLLVPCLLSPVFGN